MSKYAVTLDPGIDGTGIVVWKVERKDYWVPVEWSNVNPDPRIGDAARLELITNRVIDVILEYGGMSIETVYCEKPRFEDSARGRVASRDESLTKLAMATGALAGAFFASGIDFELLPVVEWKGQLSKKMVWKRCLAARPELADMQITSHCQDAIGIGLYKQGTLHPKQKRNCKR